MLHLGSTCSVHFKGKWGDDMGEWGDRGGGWVSAGKSRMTACMRFYMSVCGYHDEACTEHTLVTKANADTLQECFRMDFMDFINLT